MKDFRKKIVFFFITLIFGATSIFADNENTLPQPYSKDEIPQWVKDVRNTEIITLGAFPFVTLGVTLSYSLINLAKHNFDSAYFVNPFTSKSSYTKDEQIGILVTSSFICLGIGVTNLTINLIKRNAEKKRNYQVLDKNIQIIEIDNELNITPIPKKYLREKKFIYGTIQDAVF